VTIQVLIQALLAEGVVVRGEGEGEATEVANHKSLMAHH